MNFTQSTIFSITASFGLLFINMLINVIESRVLGPGEIGRYQVFITTQTLFATFCALGLGQSCIYFINALKIDERKVLATTVNMTIIIASLASIALFFIITLSPNYFGRENAVYIILFCIGTFSTLLSNIFTPVLLTKMEVVRNQIVKYAARVITLVVLAIAYVIWHGLNVGLLLGLTGVAGLVSLFILCYYFRERFSFSDGIDFTLLKKIFFWGVKLAGNNIASLVLTSIPVYFLTWFSVGDGFHAVGFYSRANSLLVIGTVIASAIGPLLYSKWSLIRGDELKGQVSRVSMLFVLANALISLGLIVLAPLLIRILYGAEYVPAVLVLQILSLSLISNGLKEICYGILSSQGAPLCILKNLLYGIVMCAVLDYYVIPVWGVIGCTIVTTIVSISTSLLLVYYVTKISNISYLDFFVMPSAKDLKTLKRSIIRQ